MPDVTPDSEVPEDARALLQRAMALHTAGEIDEALAAAEKATGLAPEFGEALSYLGNTLVTRKRRFADGLAALDLAVAAAPDDPTIAYTAGWCQEFVANALERPKGPHQPVEASVEDLYAAAKAHMLRALELDPDDGLRGDIEDILDVIAAATGEPWSDEEVTRAAPRAR
jgi:tetratricopeptide (TPR) repeat protein